MSRLRALCSHRFHPLPENPLHPSPILHRPISTSLPIEDQIQEIKTQKEKKPLVDLFKEAVGLREKPVSESESEGEGRELKRRLRELEREVRRLKSNAVAESETPKKEELNKDGVLKEQTKPKTNSLYSLFSNGKNRDGKRGESGSLEKKKEGEEEEEEPAVLKDLSEDMLLFVSHLHREGYFKDANFLPRRGLIYGAFDNSYSRAYIKFAAEKFGKDNQEIAK